MRSTVRTATLALMRELGLTTVFGNPGSTELAFLADWPTDFHYVLGLQESVVVGMADGYAQATGRAAFVNLHSAAGVGHALGAIFTACKNQTPLVITAGQQARSLLALQPFLGAEHPAEFPKPYVKWAIEPARPEDVPLAIAQAWQIAMQAPCGPTFVSIPSDDWDKPAEPVVLSPKSHLLAPDPEGLAQIARALAASHRPAIVFGPGVGRENAQDEVTALVEQLDADVWAAPMISRDGVGQDHPRFAGFLPAASRPLVKSLERYDCMLVLGGPAFLLHVPDGLEVLAQLPPLFQITDDARSAVASPRATSLIASLRLTVPALARLVAHRPATASQARDPIPTPPTGESLTPELAVQIIADLAPKNAIFVEEAPSHKTVIQRFLPISKEQGFHAMASGGLGFGLAAAAGLALGHPQRRVVALIGDGSTMYSIQSLWSAAQEKLPVTYVILNNHGYGAMRAFSQMMQIRNIPGIDVDGIDFVALARALGCPAALVETAEELDSAFRQSIASKGPMLIEVSVGSEITTLF
jgi:benzoylformate decarboxylase